MTGNLSIFICKPLYKIKTKFSTTLACLRELCFTPLESSTCMHVNSIRHSAYTLELALCCNSKLSSTCVIMVDESSAKDVSLLDYEVGKLYSLEASTNLSDVDTITGSFFQSKTLRLLLPPECATQISSFCLMVGRALQKVLEGECLMCNSF